ncbi:ABC transporter permease [Chitinibacter bivalviorum]|uniref:ABC transporter permease n=1 Tax=Chitinibacter bivalviorum TaxID=2739434 RepID=A0A7H9BHH2_9NEIS|nr:FtsX-like permease family protein [Chitinibacter bivalviorum]QLG88065.1 ABC transporter permease [Chitinibacter bivalviorum]
MNTLSLAWRNLLRNRRRSMTTLLAMVIGVIAILLFGGYSGNINLGLQTGFVRSSGHLQIQHTDYFLYGTGNPAAYGIRDYQRVIDVVKKDPVLAPMLTVVTPTLSLGGIAGNFAAGVSRTVIGSGVVVDEQNQMRLWNDYQFPGEAKLLALTGTSKNAATIGTGVARVLQLCGPLAVKNCPQAQTKVSQTKAADQNAAAAPDDITALSEQSAQDAPAKRSVFPQIELLAANAHGAPNVAALEVVKAESKGVKELDDLAVTLHLSQAQKLVYGGDVPQVTAIALQLKHSSQISAAQARLDELIKTQFKDMALEVHDYATLNPSYGQITGMFAAIFSFISLLIGAIVLFTVGNTMSMAVVERTVEIGTLRAIGLRRSGIRRLFVCEGVLLGMVGAALGVALALAAAYLVNHSGMTWMPPGNTEPVPLTVRVWGEMRMITTTAIGLLVVAAISAWWPARRAAQLNIVDALRHV